MASEGKWPPEEIKAIISEAYKKYRNRLMDYADSLGLDPETAEDLVQDTFLVILKNPEKYINSKKKYAWLAGILYFRILHFYRDMNYARRLKMLLERQYDLAQEDEIELRTLYGGIIDRTDLELLILHYDGGVPYKELSARFALEEATCRKRVQRARARLRDILGEE